MLLPNMAAQLPILIERSFTGVVTGPLCPRKGHNEFKDKGIAPVAPGAPKAKEIAEKFESSGSTRTVRRGGADREMPSRAASPQSRLSEGPIRQSRSTWTEGHGRMCACPSFR
ncbi:hypothetical protein ACFXP3_22245 [Streptomyces sp. NPDC059096]|uniref:hypothetical protein n=1 Tax=Streptomyces sp. NPDC059096 TaxID=3346727 RepID=UPI0036A9635B